MKNYQLLYTRIDAKKFDKILKFIPEVVILDISLSWGDMTILTDGQSVNREAAQKISEKYLENYGQSLIYMPIVRNPDHFGPKFKFNYLPSSRSELFNMGYKDLNNAKKVLKEFEEENSVWKSCFLKK